MTRTFEPGFTLEPAATLWESKVPGLALPEGLLEMWPIFTPAAFSSCRA
jgi:hypothetical protein